MAQTLRYAELAKQKERFAQPFPFGDEDVKHAWEGMKAFRARGGKGTPDYFLSGNPERLGVFKLFEGGPNGHYYLVLNGPQAGRIWEAPDQDLWFPTPREDRSELEQIGVLEFYENIINDLEEEANEPLPLVVIPPGQTDYGFFNSGDGKLPEGIFEATHLVSLSLTSNNLTVLNHLHKLAQLEDLNLGHNRFRVIPEGIFSLKSLQVLNLAGNRIRELPESIQELQQLTILRIGGNLIETLPSALTSLPKLAKVDLHGNPLKEVPEFCFLSSSLEAVSLRDTGISANDVDSLRKTRPDLKVIFES